MLDEKHSSDGHIEEKGFDQASYSEFEDKPLLRKIDFKLIPFLALLYLLSFLDRVNIGIAKRESIVVAGLTHLRVHRYLITFLRQCQP